MSADYVRACNAAYVLGHLEGALHPAFGEVDLDRLRDIAAVMRLALLGDPVGENTQFFQLDFSWLVEQAAGVTS